MTKRDAYAVTLRLAALAVKLTRIETTAAATGRPLPPSWPQLLAEAHVVKNSFLLALNAEQARQQFIRRHG